MGTTTNTTGPEPTRQRVLQALTAAPGATAADLASKAGLGRSTVTKALRDLEADQLARREVGGHDGKRKLPDRWTAIQVPENDTTDEAAPGVVEAAEVQVTVTPASEGETTVEPTSESAEATDEAGKPAADADSAPTPATDVRLGKGKLAELALGFLVARPGEEFTASAVGKALGRSPGAVANAFERFAKAGAIVQTSAKPRRYRIKQTGEDG